MGGSPTQPTQGATNAAPQAPTTQPLTNPDGSYRLDAEGKPMYAPVETNPQDAVMKQRSEAAQKPTTSEDAFQKAWKGKTAGVSPNSYGRDSSKPLSSEQAIDIGLA